MSWDSIDKEDACHVKKMAERNWMPDSEEIGAKKDYNDNVGLNDEIYETQAKNEENITLRNDWTERRHLSFTVSSVLVRFTE